MSLPLVLSKDKPWNMYVFFISTHTQKKTPICIKFSLSIKKQRSCQCLNLNPTSHSVNLPHYFHIGKSNSVESMPIIISIIICLHSCVTNLQLFYLLSQPIEFSGLQVMMTPLKSWILFVPESFSDLTSKNGKKRIEGKNWKEE